MKNLAEFDTLEALLKSLNASEAECKFIETCLKRFKTDTMSYTKEEGIPAISSNDWFTQAKKDQQLCLETGIKSITRRAAQKGSAENMITYQDYIGCATHLPGEQGCIVFGLYLGEIQGVLIQISDASVHRAIPDPRAVTFYVDGEAQYNGYISGKIYSSEGSKNFFEKKPIEFFQKEFNIISKENGLPEPFSID